MVELRKFTQLQEVKVRETDPRRPSVVIAGRILVVATEQERDDGIVWLFEQEGESALGIHRDWLEPTGRLLAFADVRSALCRHICDGVAYMYSYHAPSTGPIGFADNRYLLEYYHRYPRETFLAAVRWGIANARELFANYFDPRSDQSHRAFQENGAYSRERFEGFLRTLLSELEAFTS